MKKKSKNSHFRYQYLKRWLKDGTYAGGRCEKCGERLILLYRYDAVCCPACNQWLDEKCGDPQCTFCSGRPDMPEETFGAFREDPFSTGSVQKEKKAYCVRRYELDSKGRRHRAAAEQKILYRERREERRHKIMTEKNA